MIEYTNDLETINYFLKKFNTQIKEINNYKIFMIIKNNNRNIAFIDFSFIYDRIEINYIFVEKEFRKLGYASKIFYELLLFSKEKKCNNITLEVNEKNIAAINFYKKHNFIIATKRKNYYENSDGLLMIREVI